MKTFEQYNFHKEIEDIDYANFNIKNVKDRDMFDYIYSNTPASLKQYIDSMRDIDQRRDYHPEIDVYTHTKVVVSRIAKTKDIDLILSAFLHDTGKDRTQKIENGIIMQPGHEVYSSQLLNIGSPWRDWVKNLGGDPDIIRFIIRNHMKMKDMKHNNKNVKWFDKLESKYKKYLEIFSDSDSGGFFNESYAGKEYTNVYPTNQIGKLINGYIDKNISKWEKEGWTITLSDSNYWSDNWNIIGEEMWEYFQIETLQEGIMDNEEGNKNLLEHVKDTTKLEIEVDGLIVGMDGINLLNYSTDQMKEYSFQKDILEMDESKVDFIIKLGVNEEIKKEYSWLFDSKRFKL